MAYQATKGGRLYAGGRSQKPQVPERLAPEAVRHPKRNAGLKEMESRCAARGDLGRAAVLFAGSLIL